MVKGKNRDNTFYWNCDLKKVLNCKGRATTTLIGNNFLKNFSEHCHAAEASRLEIS